VRTAAARLASAKLTTVVAGAPWQGPLGAWFGAVCAPAVCDVAANRRRSESVRAVVDRTCDVIWSSPDLHGPLTHALRSGIVHETARGTPPSGVEKVPWNLIRLTPA
jgi:hypothetical protein